VAAPVAAASRWDYSHWAGREPEPYGDEVTYRLGLGWLAALGCERIEDWGAGLAYGRRFAPEGRYTAIDSCPSAAPWVDHFADLLAWEGRPDGLFMRHVLEHEPRWEALLDHAAASFGSAMCLVIFTPFGERTAPLRADSFLDLSFRKADLTARLTGPGLSFTERRVVTGTRYGAEHVFFIRREVPA